MPGFTGATVTAGIGCTLSYTLTASPLLSGADPQLGAQWHLRNTGQRGGTPGEDLRAIDAWALTRGAGARIAVIDDSVEVTHPDLQPNLVLGGSRSYRPGNLGSAWPLPCSGADDHGTAVAGLAVARDDNAVGVAGVAPRAAFVGFDALASGLDADVADALTRDGALNHVYHNSWGAPDDGSLHPPEASFRAAIETGLSTGRQGKGSVYVFSAGNGACYERSPLTGACFDDNANYDGYVNHKGVIAVCAVDAFGRRASYSEPGANLTVCAPSGNGGIGVVTLGLRGSTRNDFSGTSAAAPMVSGVVALMLSVNPSLTWRDVRLILAQTARQSDPLHAAQPLAYGYRFSHDYGFGVVDAKAAVELARSWTSVGGSDTLRSCVLPVRAPAIAIPDARADGSLQPVTDAVTVAGCGITALEWVELRMTADHPYPGDLRVRLSSPGGQVSRLAEVRECRTPGCGVYADWRFGSIRHLGEPADGIWTLEVADGSRDALGTGTLQQWSLILHGR